jgi:hypothetical protein
MSRWERNLLVLILLISTLLSITSFTRGHVWWDDFASYIMQAQSLLHGTPADFVAHNRFTIENSSYPPGPVAYPWGFPALLAPFVAIFGLKISGLKLLNTFFFLCFLYLFYRLTRLRLPPGWSLVPVAILAWNPVLLAAHDLILSDIPFLFFSTLAIYMIESGAGSGSARRALILGLVILAAFSLRTNGVLLLVPLLVSQLITFKSSTPTPSKLILLFPYLVFGAGFLLLALLLPGGQESYFTHFSMFNIGSFLGNILYYLQLPADLVKNIPFGLFFMAIIALLFLLDGFLNLRRNLVLLSYIAASLALLVAWPETQGLRFIYPLLPLLLLMAGEGLLTIVGRLPLRSGQALRWTGVALAAALVLVSLGVSARHSLSNMRSGRETNGPFDPVSRQMFEFIRDETPPDSVVVFFKPRLMQLLTARDSFLTTRCEDLPRADYVVLHEKQGSNDQIGSLSICPGISYPIVFNNLRFTVYQVTH